MSPSPTSPLYGPKKNIFWTDLWAGAVHILHCSLLKYERFAHALNLGACNCKWYAAQSAIKQLETVTARTTKSRASRESEILCSARWRLWVIFYIMGACLNDVVGRKQWKKTGFDLEWRAAEISADWVTWKTEICTYFIDNKITRLRCQGEICLMSGWLRLFYSLLNEVC